MAKTLWQSGRYTEALGSVYDFCALCGMPTLEKNHF